MDPEEELLYRHLVKDTHPVINVVNVNGGPDEEWPVEDRLLFLLRTLHSIDPTLSDKRKAAFELRRLTERNESHRLTLAEIDSAISMLIYPLTQATAPSIDIGLRRDITSTILNISLPDDNKRLVAETPGLMKVVFDGIVDEKDGDTTRLLALSVFFELSKLDSNTEIIHESINLGVLFNSFSGVIMWVDIAERKAYNPFLENMFTTKKPVYQQYVHVLLGLFNQLSTNEKCVDKLSEIVPGLLSLIKAELGFSNEDKENSITILYAICLRDNSKLEELKGEEEAITQVAKGGTSRISEKANLILEMLKPRV